MSLITVLLPVYNGMPFLPDALESLRAQTLRDFRLIVVDGGSSDGSMEYLQQLRDDRVSLFRCKKGLGKQLMLGLHHCNTKFVARMDADDLCAPERLEKQLRFLRDNPSVGLVGTQYRHFVTDLSRNISPRLPLDHEAIYSQLREGRLALVHASMMCKTDSLRSAGGYQVAGSGEDWDMFLRLGELTQLANLNETLYFWRLHAGSVTVRSTADCVLRIKYACDSARRRSRGLSEVSYDTFKSQQQSAITLLLHNIDCYSLLQYRLGLYDLLSEKRLAGAIRLAWAALCSPSRSSNWIRKSCRRYLSSGYKQGVKVA
jgi:glycosyltransferase involved in cell wall biosynthesis